MTGRGGCWLHGICWHIGPCTPHESAAGGQRVRACIHACMYYYYVVNHILTSPCSGDFISQLLLLVSPVNILSVPFSSTTTLLL